MTYDELKTEFLRRVNLLKLTDMTALNHKCAEILGKIVSENVFEIDDISGACKKILHEYYELMNETNARLQKEIDKKIGLQIAAQKADFPAERVAKVAKALTDPTVPSEIIQRRARNAVENVANSFHDDYVRENAKFRSKAGIKCYIVRETDGNCCKWCSSLAGRYVYGDEPDDIFHRHDNCTCTTTFENGRERQDVWSKKKWQVTPVLKIPYEPLVLDRNQAQNLQNIQLAKYKNSRNGLTFISNSSKIESGKNYGERRKQIDIPYNNEVNESDLPEFNRNALKSIIEETGYSEEEAKKFHSALIEWFGGDYEEFTAGNRKEQEKIINNGLARMGAYDGTIGRGMVFSDKSEYDKIACLKIGEIVPGKSIYAWSSEMDIAKNYSAIQYKNKDSVLLVCDDNKTGVGMQHISKYGKTEAEILAPSTTKYEIIDKQVINKYDYFVQNENSSDMSAQDKRKRLDKLFRKKDEISKYSITIFKVKEV